MGTIRNVGQVSITVRDLLRAVIFYRDVLELQYIWETNGMAFFQCGEVRLMLSLPESGGSNFGDQTSVLYFNVDDIDKTYQDLSSKGVEFKGKPHEIGRLGERTIMMAFFSDTENNLVAIQSEILTVQ